MGDPGGVGPEVVLKALSSFKKNHKIAYLMIGPLQALQRFPWFKEKIVFTSTKNASSIQTPGIYFFDITKQASELLLKKHRKITAPVIRAGKISIENSAFAWAALAWAAKNAALGNVDGIATAPVNKSTMRLFDPKFHGHTEYLAQTAKAKSFAMMFVSERLKVTLVTIHEPIQKISRLIRKKNVAEKIKLTHEFLTRRYKIKNPRIAVCALNPHGKETGVEDEREIRPAVEFATRQGINAVGPLSADQIFYDAYQGRFDAVIAMYHDQGLAPFKMIAFEEGVNLTLGLPYVRTSPDHGTAFDIAYQNKANPVSMLSAIRLAENLILA